MLTMEPEERYTAVDCIADPFFDGLRDPDTEKMVM